MSALESPDGRMSPDGRIKKMRHDLANPLSAILAEAQLMLLNHESLDSETVQSLKDIEGLARRMRDILQQY